jgi:lipid II:glycine glycyltransferase (peptidoglycan interpeptide bridge formation enzyme)
MVFQPLVLFVKLFEESLLDVFIAKQGDKITGGLCCIKDCNNIYHYNWGASLNINNIAIGTLLINHAMAYAYSCGYKYFDLGSTSLSDDNLLNFKLKWGAQNYPVYQYYTLNRPHSVDLNNSYLFYRNIYSKFPKALLRALMPKIIPFLVQ